MVNTWAKGLVTQRKVIEEIARQGEWQELLFKSQHTYGGTTDFGPADLVYARGRERLYISCKTDPANNFLIHQHEITRWMREHAHDGDEARLYIWRGGQWRGAASEKVWISPHLDCIVLGNLWEAGI